MNNEDIFVMNHLAHYGVKGMRWGVRKSVRQANKDAKETARAKQFYGEGAGTRRKLIKAKVEGRSKNNEAYAKAYVEALARQNPSKHAEKAISERRRKDFAKRNKQRAGFLARNFTGQQGTQAAFAAAALAGVTFLSTPKGQAMLNQGLVRIRSAAQSRAGQKLVTDFMKRAGG
jgi:hypothetical protein